VASVSLAVPRLALGPCAVVPGRSVNSAPSHRAVSSALSLCSSGCDPCGPGSLLVARPRVRGSDPPRVAFRYRRAPLSRLTSGPSAVPSAPFCLPLNSLTESTPVNRAFLPTIIKILPATLCTLPCYTLLHNPTLICVPHTHTPHVCTYSPMHIHTCLYKPSLTHSHEREEERACVLSHLMPPCLAPSHMLTLMTQLCHGTDVPASTP
jgi:hypothetical protein